MTTNYNLRTFQFDVFRYEHRDTLANVPFTYTNEPDSPRISTHLFALLVPFEQTLYKKGRSYKYLPSKTYLAGLAFASYICINRMQLVPDSASPVLCSC